MLTSIILIILYIERGINMSIYEDALKRINEAQKCKQSCGVIIGLTGPQGIQGLTGETGPTGATGATGPAGVPGGC